MIVSDEKIKIIFFQCAAITTIILCTRQPCLMKSIICVGLYAYIEHQKNYYSSRMLCTYYISAALRVGSDIF